MSPGSEVDQTSFPFFFGQPRLLDQPDIPSHRALITR